MEQRKHFSKFGFIMAAAGSAVGLGNIWKFPYITYENGGGSFVLVYLLAILLVGIPLMFAELLIGRRTQKSPIGAFLTLSKNLAGGAVWSIAGWLGIAAGFVILSFYSVVAGWTVYYFWKCLKWSTLGFSEAQAATLGADFGAFLGDGGAQVAFHAVFMGATMVVVSFGVQKGIERFTKVLMPVLVGILVLLCLNSMRTPGFSEAISFLFHWEGISSESLLEAVGHSFFTLSLGMGAMITYGSYVSKSDSLAKAGLWVVFFDTLIALLACVIMFSIIFSVPELERKDTFSKSAAMLFTTLPRMFYGMPGGALLSPVFYLLVALAALSSTISLLEVVVAYFVDEKSWPRKKSVLTIGFAIFLFGIPSALSLGASSSMSSFKFLGTQATGFFDHMDYLASNWLLPLGGLLIAVFVAWVLPTSSSREELQSGESGALIWYPLWLWSLRIIAPGAILWIIISVLSGQKFN